MTLSVGDTGSGVRILQRLLIDAGAAIEPDGWFGDDTERAVRAYQRSHDLVADGIAGPKTMGRLRGRPLAKTLTHADIERAAERLGVDVASVLAVNEVESRGEGFDSGYVVVLFERHVMYRRMRIHGLDAGRAAQAHPDLVSRTPGGYVGGTGENQRLARAQGIDDLSALESASWGAFQIMGYHWERLGYANMDAFVTAMRRDEASQLQAFVRFIEADSMLRGALRNQNWAGFARLYNGPAYERNDYDTKLAAAYRRHVGAMARAA